MKINFKMRHKKTITYTISKSDGFLMSHLEIYLVLYFVGLTTVNVNRKLTLFNILLEVILVVQWLHARIPRGGLRILSGSPPDASRAVAKLRVGAASAGDTHTLARRTNPTTASIVPRYRVA